MKAAAFHAERRRLLRPENLREEKWIALGLFGASFAYLCLFRRFTAMDPDEGIILQGAQRILHGQVLYRDFFSFFTPGSYYLLALLFRIFGSSMLVVRTALAVYGGLFSVFTYLLARRVCSRWCALLTVYLLTITCLPWRFMALHNWDSTLWACAAIYCAVRWLEAVADQQAAGSRRKAEVAQSFPPLETLRPLPESLEKSRRLRKARNLRVSRLLSLSSRLWSPSWWALATGSFASITVLFEQSKGAGLILGFVLGIALVTLLGRGRIRLGAKDWSALGAGLLWPLVLTLAYFAAHHALHPMLVDWFWPFHHYTSVNRVPYGYQDWSSVSRKEMFYSGSLTTRLVTLLTVSPCFVIPVLPIVAVVLLGYWVFGARRGMLAPERAAHYILVCSSVAGLLVSVILVRANIIHFVYLAPIFYLVLAWLMDGADIHGRLVTAMRPLVTILILVAFTAVGMAFVVRNRSGHERIKTRRGWVTAPAADTVVQYTQAHVAAGSKILVYPYLPLYYYLTATYSPTRFEYLQPGMNTRKQDEEAIREVETSRARVVLFEPGFDEKIVASWPNTPMGFIANDPVGDYILAHYRSCKVLQSAGGWRFLFMIRNGLACPKK